ncbi:MULTISPECIES: distal tail protein Dit [Clostridium]|uniref:distal tail protein Dit n=1 Tax=Clostridium TaxID=1485 RepID=UPI0024BD21B0|nr:MULTISPECIES: distal tail protein Dit [Clostridium]EGT0682036.1 phage tail protein [Clostridium perfringens]MDU2095062.1 phage tail protein [Clostridium perfringens]MDU2228061.1 phage tail protein [Clostridium perfringens]MDU4145898.1 phage tail protein [Clostridium sp.]
MRKPFSFNFNHKNSWTDFKIKILEITIPFPKRKESTIKIPGGEDLVEVDGGYEDITIPVKMDILDKRLIETKYREIKKWLSFIEDDHFILSDDLGFFYKVKMIDLKEFITEFQTCGNATVNFTCSPYLYSVNGEYEIDFENNLFNEFQLNAEPVYKIVGNGTIKLNINSKIVTIDLADEIIVDIPRKLTLRNGYFEGKRKKGEWEDLELIPGDNILSYELTPGSNLESFTLIPNWRTL